MHDSKNQRNLRAVQSDCADPSGTLVPKPPVVAANRPLTVQKLRGILKTAGIQTRDCGRHVPWVSVSYGRIKIAVSTTRRHVKEPVTLRVAVPRGQEILIAAAYDVLKDQGFAIVECGETWFEIPVKGTTNQRWADHLATKGGIVDFGLDETILEVVASPVVAANRLTRPIDELCECGSLMSEHGLGSDGKTPNRGACGDCPKFEFAGFVFAEDLQVAA